jgi:hypothetical protein
MTLTDDNVDDDDVAISEKSSRNLILREKLSILRISDRQNVNAPRKITQLLQRHIKPARHNFSSSHRRIPMPTRKVSSASKIVHNLLALDSHSLSTPANSPHCAASNCKRHAFYCFVSCNAALGTARPVHKLLPHCC